MNKTKGICLIMTMATALLTSGCNCLYTDGQSAVHLNWGRAFESERYVQHLNPDSIEPTKAVTDMQGPVSQSAMDRYYSTFEMNKPVQPIYNINMSGLK